MRAERAVRFGGLALVLLFPLLSVLQLRDADKPWRDAARRARGSVLGFIPAEPGAVGWTSCGVVLQVSPARAVVPGRVTGTLTSLHGTSRLDWQPLYTDVQGEFTVLEVVRGTTEATAGSMDPTTLLTPAKLALDPRGVLTEDIEAALVAPSELAEQPLWVGVLSIGSSKTGRLGYFSNFLTPLSGENPLITNAAMAAATEPQIDPKLRGAPFVDANGKTVAMFLDHGERGVHALPLEIVVQALAILHLQAAQ